MLTPNQRWNRVKDLFERALEEMPSDLEEWLDQQGEIDELARKEVLSLFRHNPTGSFLVQPFADQFPDHVFPDSHSVQPGQVVWDYTIVREIGRGGMGRVYLATDNHIGRQVALKVLAPELARDPEHRERLRREASIMAKLSDAGICTLYGFKEIDGEAYMASEFLDGRTLRAEIEEGPLPSVEAVRRTALDLARPLASAHAQGITHRDFKPENVMRRTGDGRLKVLDFGIARVVSVAGGFASMAGTLTVPSAVIGTPAYMAPEQLLGERADSRTDVFAFGLVLYEYACGIHPFASDQPSANPPSKTPPSRDVPGGRAIRAPWGIMGRILESEPTPLTQYRRDLPAGLVTIINRCLCKAPDERFASAGELVVALNRLEPDRSPAPAPDRLTNWWRTHQLAAIALYFTACVLAWQVKEWEPGIATALFMATCIAATVGGVFRGHLLFTQRVTSVRLTAERRRANPVTLATDLTVALALLLDGGILAWNRPVPAVLTCALGVGILLTRILVEPATTEATFTHSESA